MVDEYFQYLQSMDEDGSSAQGLVAEVINLFIANANRILPFFPYDFVISSWVMISSALLCDSQEQARDRLQQGGRPGASAQGVHQISNVLFFNKNLHAC